MMMPTPAPIDETRRCLDLRGYAIVAVASGADIPRSTLYRYLNGEAPRIHPEHLKRLANFLDQPAHVLEEAYRSKKHLVELEKQQLNLFPLGDDFMNDNFSSRRDFLQRAVHHLFALPALASLLTSLHFTTQTWTLLTQALEKPSLLDEETVARFERLTNSCWILTDQGRSNEVRALLVSYLGSIAALARETSPFQKRLAALTSQGFQMLYVLSSHEEEFKSALMHSQKARSYAMIAGDPNLEAAALIRQGVVHLHRKSPHQALEAYEQILPFQQQLSPLLRARLYANLSEVQGKLQMLQESLKNIRLSEEAFPEDPATDPASRYIHFKASSIPLHEALALLDLQQPAAAARVLAQIDMHTLSKRSVVDVFNQQAYAAIALKERDQVVASLREAVPLARQQGSDLRKSESWDVVTKALAVWPKDRAIRGMMQLF